MRSILTIAARVVLVAFPVISQAAELPAETRTVADIAYHPAQKTIEGPDKQQNLKS